MQIYLESLGCRLNQSEIEYMARRFDAAGHVLVGDPAQADACILNTCAVTVEAARKSRQRARALRRANAGSPVAVVGCYATLAPERCATLAGPTTVVIPNPEKDRTVEEVIRAVGPETESFPPAARVAWGGRTRAFVKVQDGCDNRCTYCIVRHLRGPGRSRPLERVVDEVRTLTDCEGYREAVLTGVNLGSYGRDLGMVDGLRRLVDTLLAETDLPRLRLSSLEPWDVDETFFELWEDPRVCRQLHLPLQAGYDETLRRMGRRITSAEFARLADAAREAIPDVALTTDVMVGFPGEDEAAFRASYDFVERMAFARLHVFRYSPRPGTPAVKLPNRVPREVAKARSRRMRKLGAAQARRFRERFVGRTMSVLWEQRREDGRWSGLTDNYIRVLAPCAGDLHNRLTETRLMEAEGAHLVGEVIQ